MSDVLTVGLIQARAKTDNLKAITKLNVWGVGFRDVSILRQTPNLEVLAMPVNNISSLKELAGLGKLRELSVRNNKIASFTELQHLQLLDSLEILWLDENPCADHPKYRAIVMAMLPRLKKLDNREVTEEERQAARKVDLAALLPTR